jgi:CheY-like chemotaxis protein
VVDDHEHAAQVLSQMLQSDGFVVEAVHAAARAAQPFGWTRATPNP